MGSRLAMWGSSSVRSVRQGKLTQLVQLFCLSALVGDEGLCWEYANFSKNINYTWAQQSLGSLVSRTFWRSGVTRLSAQ